MLTNADARDNVIAAIEANGTDVAARDEYDIDSIVKAIRAATGDYDVNAMEPADFWAIVEQHQLDVPTALGPQAQEIIALVDTIATASPEKLREFGAWKFPAGEYNSHDVRDATASAADAAASAGRENNCGKWRAAWDNLIDSRCHGEPWPGSGGWDVSGLVDRRLWWAAVALTSRDLIGDVFTIAHFDLITRPWVEVFGHLAVDTAVVAYLVGETETRLIIVPAGTSITDAEDGEVAEIAPGGIVPDSEDETEWNGYVAGMLTAAGYAEVRREFVAGRGTDTRIVLRPATTDPNPTEVTIYEDNAGAVYLERGGEAWGLGPVTADLIGTAAENAQAWVNGEWEPSEDDGQVRADVDDLDVIATWRPAAGLVAEMNYHGELAAGAGGADFLGVTGQGGATR